MKKCLTLLLSFLFVTINCFMLSACDKSSGEFISNKVYFQDSVTYYVYGNNNSTAVSQDNFFNDSPDLMKKYTQMYIKGNKKWVSGLNIEYIDLYFIASSDVELDVAITITNLVGSNNENKDTKELYSEEKFSISLTSKKEEKFRVYINDKVKDDYSTQLTIYIDDACYSGNDKVKTAITKLNISAYHE